MFFFIDSAVAHPHAPDVSALIRQCCIHDVPLALNRTTADAIVTRLAHAELGRVLTPRAARTHARQQLVTGFPVAGIGSRPSGATPVAAPTGSGACAGCSRRTPRRGWRVPRRRTRALAGTRSTIAMWLFSCNVTATWSRPLMLTYSGSGPVGATCAMPASSTLRSRHAAGPPPTRSTIVRIPRRELGDLAFVDVLVAFVLDRDGRVPAVLGDVDRVRLTTQVVRCHDRTSAQVDDHQHPDGSACDFEVLTTSLPSAVAAAISAAVCSAAELFRSTGIVSNRWSRADTDAVAGAAERINTKATRPAARPDHWSYSAWRRAVWLIEPNPG